jgi:hypothetical protein
MIEEEFLRSGKNEKSFSFSVSCRDGKKINWDKKNIKQLKFRGKKTNRVWLVLGFRVVKYSFFLSFFLFVFSYFCCCLIIIIIKDLNEKNH